MPKTPQFPPNARLVEIVAFPDVQILDVTGPMQVFASANAWARKTNQAAQYLARVVARESPVPSRAGLSLVAEPLTLPGKPIDTLIIAGGEGVDRAADDKSLVEWVTMRAQGARRVASICTGAFLLGACGLLAGRRVVTHWERCDELATRFPEARVESDPIFIEDENLWTSAGVTAGIDMTLALVERDLGHAAAMFVARDLVVFLKRPGGQAQFSTVLRLQTGDGRFDRLHSWIADNLHKRLSIGVLANQAGMSERSFIRHYGQLVGDTPARAIERMRVEAARELLSTTGLPVKSIAQRCGFGSEETMRRSFVRVIAVPPQDYRRRFRLSNSIKSSQ